MNIVISNLNNSCWPGTSLYTACKLLLEKREDKKIFLILDGLITNKYELNLTFDLIDKCEKEEIDLIAISLCHYPYSLNKIFPKFFYSSSFKKYYECLSIFLNNYLNIPRDSINHKLIKGKEINYNNLLKFKKISHLMKF